MEVVVVFICEHTCCFIGHRKIEITEELKNRLEVITETLIQKNAVDTFLFGSKSDFNSLCFAIVTKLKEKYPYISRIYVRAEYAFINDSYRGYLLEKYEDTYYPKQVLGAGKSAYIKRNYEMIQKSRFCIFYYRESYKPSYKSGTKIAFEYAKKLKKELFQLP